MPGLWVMRGRAMVYQDQLLNTASMEILEQVQTRLQNQEAWPSVRRWFYKKAGKGGKTGLGPKTEKHVVDHWFNEDDEGWWPQCLMSQIYGETIFQIIRLAKETGTRLPVRSYWICPGINHFQVAVCVTEEQLTAVYMTPPQPDSKHRPGFLSYIEPKPGVLGQAGKSDRDGATIKLGKDLGNMTDRDPPPIEPGTYFPGRKVKIVTGGRRPQYRRISRINSRGNTIALEAPCAMDADVTVWPMGTPSKPANMNTIDEGFDHLSRIWMVSAWDNLADEREAVPIDPKDTTETAGVVVRRAKTTHDPNKGDSMA